MANALGNKQHMLLANHGIITTGETIAEGFNYLYYFEKAAETYLTALSTKKELNVVAIVSGGNADQSQIRNL